MTNRPREGSGASTLRTSLLTARDAAIVDSTIRLGAVTAATLQALHAPTIRAETFRARLRTLHRHGYLRQTRHVGPGQVVWLYTAGPAALAPGESRPWQPSLNQLGHTLAVGDTLTQLLLPGLLTDIEIVDWQGEAELRAWDQPGHPRPDLRLAWAATSQSVGEAGRPATGRLQVEVDQGTEARAAWHRKLARYLLHTPAAQILVVTVHDSRARTIAAYAREVGVFAFATTQDAVHRQGTAGYDAASGRRTALQRALSAR